MCPGRHPHETEQFLGQAFRNDGDPAYQINETPHLIQPWGTAGNDLESYLQQHYFASGEVPEPGSWLLATAGGILLLAFRISASPRHRSPGRRGSS